MAYKTLYRVYRPQTFDDVVGQEHIITTLKNAIRENKIGHAYLFCGPRGTGKTTVAKLLAKAVNCSGNVKPCGECDNCKAIQEGSHPDVIEIDGASNNGVNEARDLIDKVKFAPINGKYKVYIIDEVHMITPEAFNALLKTLEEPPSHVIFILATTEPYKILPTIISRCQRFDFTKIALKDIINRLKEVTISEGCKVDDEALELIAKLSDGGMRDALSILEQSLAYNDNNLSINDVYSIYGMLSIENKINFIKVLLSKDMNKALSIFEDMINSGIDIKRLTFDIIDILKDVIIYKNTNNLDILFVLSSSYLNMINPYITSEEAFLLIDILMEASEKYSRTTNPSTYFELAILKMCNKSIEEKEMKKIENENIVIEKPSIEVDEDNNDIIKVEDEQSQEIPVFEFEEKKEVQKTNENIIVNNDDIMNILVQARREILTEIQEKWPVIRRYLSNLNTAKSASMLCDGKPVAACKGGLIISYEYIPDVNAVNYYKNYNQLSNFLKDFLGEEYKFIAISNEEWPNIRKQFIKLKRNNKLPKPHEITLNHIKKYVNDESDDNEAAKYAKNIFGNIVETED